ncbi:MAG: purine-nucleoside phosphorylase [Desulfobacterales bacterium]
MATGGAHDRREVMETADFLRARIDRSPRIGLFTGTGLGESIASISISSAFAFGDLPHFPVSTVESHPGRLLFGTAAGRPVVIMQGRFHLYEGYAPRAVTFPVRVMRQLGVDYLILTNAAGGLNPRFRAGDLMTIGDHINLTGANPLVGRNEESWGVRFPDMSRAYDPHLRRLAADGARAAGVRMHTGVYAGLKGPSLETPAEVRYLKTIGADAVGFSTVQEVIAARHAGLRVLGLSIITNLGDPDAPQPATMAEIIAVAGAAAPGLATVVRYVVEHIDDDSRRG